MAVRDYIAKYQADLTGWDLDPAIRETQDLQRAEDELARNTATTADKVAASWREMARDVDTSGQHIDRTVTEVDHDTRAKLGDTGKEAGNEFVQNLGESVSSGDLSSIAQDTAGGLASTFGMAGPIGVAFAGLATGASLIFAGIQAHAQKVSEATSAAFDDLISASDKESKFRNQVTALYGDFQGGIVELGKLAEQTGVPMQDIADALTGGGRAAQKLQEQIRLAIPGTDKQLLNARGISQRYLEQVASGKKLLSVLDDSVKAQYDAADAAGTYKSAIKDATKEWDTFGRARAKALENKRTAVDFSDVRPYSSGRRRG